jgi:CheY-like chemotaxis protein
MFGEVVVESEVGEGSTFWVDIPLKKAEERENGDADESKKQEWVADEFCQEKKRNLVAEDNEINQMVARKILEKEGFEVDIVETGTDAVKAVEENEYAFVLMDIQMPEMDGYEATSVIRETEKVSGEHIPIIALTASAMEEDRQLCFDAGMDDYVPKPVDKEDLLRALRESAQSYYNISDN